jgi:hypothetical protein
VGPKKWIQDPRSLYNGSTLRYPNHLGYKHFCVYLVLVPIDNNNGQNGTNQSELTKVKLSDQAPIPLSPNQILINQIILEIT